MLGGLYTMQPKDTYTLEQYANSGKNVTISYNNLSYRELINSNLIVPIFNVLDDYIDDLKRIAVTVQLTDDQYYNYMYKPKLLSQDIYGNTELYIVILRLNGMCDMKEFNKKKLKMLTIDNMNEALTLIYNTEKKYIDQYNKD